MTEETAKVWHRILSISLRLIGIVGIIFVPLFWAVTDRFEFGMLAFFGTVAGVGQGFDVLKEIAESRGK